ncbi:MAG: hypothetical protein M3419_09780 [Actinomycetota bacterium]|nr:hypothetical protein [Actinomycetota bacterium]
MSNSTAPPSPQRSVVSLVALLVLTALGGTGIFWLLRDALVDDAFITLSYARNLGLHGEWALISGHQSNTATSPLNVLVLGALVAIVREPTAALGILHVATCVLLVLGLRGLGQVLGLADRLAWIATPLLLLNPLLASSLGLETLLVVTALVHLAWAAGRTDPVRFGLVAGACIWLRLDSVVLVAVLFLLTPALLRGCGKAVGLAAAVVLPWLAFSWVALGSAVPDTLVIKQHGSFGEFATGLFSRWGESYPDAVLAATAPAAVGLAAALGWWWWRTRLTGGSAVVPALATAGVAYFAVIWLLGVAPYFWYYGPTLAALTLVAAVAAAAVLGAATPVPRAVALAVVGVVGLVMAYPWVQDVGSRAPLGSMPIHGNWARPAQYEMIGREMGQQVGDAGVRGPGEIGSLAYHCRCAMSDKFSDRGRIVDVIDERAASSWLLRLNYHFLDREEIEPIVVDYRLRWKRGPDPTASGWDVRGRPKSPKRDGHFVLVRTGRGAGERP